MAEGQPSPQGFMGSRHELMHHDHLHVVERQPVPGAGLEDQLDDFAGIEVAADKFGVRLVLL